MSSEQRFEINRVDTTHAATVTYVGVIDAQIQELTDKLDLLQKLRGAVARTFGIDRPDGGSFVEKLTAGATRAQFEGEKKAGTV